MDMPAVPNDLDTNILDETFLADVLCGLRSLRKTLPCKYFYDETGSELFDCICETDEYYVTRTEQTIMADRVTEMVALWEPSVRLVEYGSGSSLKTRALLDLLHPGSIYHPVDISGDYLHRVADELRDAFPALEIEPISADFTEPIPLPEPTDSQDRQTVVYFPGSTIGNFSPREAERLLRSIAELIGSGGGLLIGADLAKPAEILEPAYDDSEGVTAAFNLNLLQRINRELDADFDLERFAHRAIYNEADSRIEMHLESLDNQLVTIAGHWEVPFRRGETIHTENSHKYSKEAFAQIADRAGLEQRAVWTDDDELFSVQWLVAR